MEAIDGEVGQVFVIDVDPDTVPAPRDMNWLPKGTHLVERLGGYGWLTSDGTLLEMQYVDWTETTTIPNTLNTPPWNRNNPLIQSSFAASSQSRLFLMQNGDLMGHGLNFFGVVDPFDPVPPYEHHKWEEDDGRDDFGPETTGFGIRQMGREDPENLYVVPAKKIDFLHRGKLSVFRDAKIKDVACNARTSGLVLDNGQVYVWGEEGSVGRGVFSGDGDPGFVFPKQTKFPGGAEMKSISCHSSIVHPVFYCVSKQGDIFAFGKRSSVTSIMGDISKPMLIPLPNSQKTDAVECGKHFAMCVSTEGQLFVWGHNHPRFRPMGRMVSDGYVFPPKAVMKDYICRQIVCHDTLSTGLFQHKDNTRRIEVRMWGGRGERVYDWRPAWAKTIDKTIILLNDNDVLLAYHDETTSLVIFVPPKFQERKVDEVEERLDFMEEIDLDFRLKTERDARILRLLQINVPPDPVPVGSK